MPPSGPLPEALRRLMAASPVGRRGFLRGAGLAGLGVGRSGAAVRVRHQGRQADRRLLRQRRPVLEREVAALLQLAALHRREEGQAGRQEGDGLPVPEEVRDRQRRQGRLRHRRQRQLRVLRSGPQPARRLPAHRPRHHDADRLDGRPDGRPRLAAEAGQVEDAQRRGQPRARP